MAPRSTNRKVTIALGLFLSVLYLSPAFAYVLPGRFILEMMAEKGTGKASRIRVEQTLKVLPSEGPKEPIELDEILRYVFAIAFRSDLKSKQVHRIHVSTTTESLTVLDKTIMPESETRFDLYKDVFLYNSRPLLEKKLQSLGIDYVTSSLGRFENRVSFVVGAIYPDVSKSQIWIDKETFRPIRLLLTGGNDPDPGTHFEIRYLDWIETADIRYPRQIAFYQSNRLTRVIEVKKIQTDPIFPAGTFNISALKAEFAPAGQPVSPSGKTDEMNEVKKTIEEFKKIYD